MKERGNARPFQDKLCLLRLRIVNCLLWAAESVGKFNEFVHSCLDVLPEAVVDRLKDLLEATQRHFWVS